MRILAVHLASSYHSINAILIRLNIAYLNVLIYAETPKVMWLYCFINLKIMGFPICDSFISGKMPGNPLPRESVPFEW